jgi:hypothetical protein
VVTRRRIEKTYGCCLNIVADLALKRTKLPLNQSLKLRVSNRPLSVNKSVKQLTHSHSTPLILSGLRNRNSAAARREIAKVQFASIIIIKNQSAQGKDERRKRARVVGRRRCALCSNAAA